jgi:small subunit ribosomal protein S17e
VKKASRKLIEIYYNWLTHDFATNKRIIHTFAEIQTKRLRNKIAGFTTYLLGRISRGPVRGISLRIKDEKSGRRVISLPQLSILKVEQNEVDYSSTQMFAQMFAPRSVQWMDGSREINTNGIVSENMD